MIRVRPVTFIVAGTDGDGQRRELSFKADDEAGLLLRGRYVTSRSCRYLS